MSTDFTVRGGYIVAEAQLHSNGCNGLGSAELPILAITLQFLFRAHEDLKCGLDIQELRCRVSAFEQAYIAHALPKRMQIRLKAGEERSKEYVYIEVPLDRERLASIERSRKGGDVRLQLDMELFIDEVVPVGPHPELPNRQFVAIGERHKADAQINIVVSRSNWVERILPGMHFGKSHIIELPIIPLNQTSGSDKAVAALHQAQKMEKDGHYNECLINCRKAIEPLLEHVDKPNGQPGQKIPKLKASWQTRLGQRTYDWLNDSLGAVKSPMNQSAHPSNPNFGQLEAQMLLMITTALVAYATKAGET